MIDRELRDREQQAERVAGSQGLRVEKASGGYRLYDDETNELEMPPGHDSGPTTVWALEPLERRLRRPGLDKPHFDPLNRS